MDTLATYTRLRHMQEEIPGLVGDAMGPTIKIDAYNKAM